MLVKKICSAIAHQKILLNHNNRKTNEYILSLVWDLLRQ